MKRSANFHSTGTQEFAAMKLNAEEKRHRESEARLNSIIEKHRGK
jgi:hypothetical protein